MESTIPTRFGSRYTIGRRLGRGSFGTVYEATAEGLDHPVAIKLLHPDLADDVKTVNRFVEERRHFKQLDHPNVVKVHELIVEGDNLGIVMEYVGGGDLRQRQLTQPMTPAEIVALMAQVADGLAAVHRANLVHRDLKPANILIDDSQSPPSPKITDFGVSRLVAHTSTRSSAVVGTPLYLAPESASDRPGPPADVYALGAMLFELLTGHPPFEAESPFALITKHAVEQPPLLVGAPDDLRDLIDRMLAKDPEQRPEPADVAASLTSFAPSLADLAAPLPFDRPGSEATTVAAAPRRSSPESLTATGDVEATGYVARVGPSGTAPVEAVQPSRSRLAGRRKLLAPIAVVAAMLVMAGGAFAMSGGADDETATQTEATDTSESADNSAPTDGTDSPTTTVAPADQTSLDSVTGQADVVGPATDGQGQLVAAPNTLAGQPGTVGGQPGTVGGVSGGTASPTVAPTVAPTAAPTTAPTTATTQRATTQAVSLGTLSISGPTSVQCWGANQTYTVKATGSEPMTSFNWNTSVGLQTPWNAGPSAILSFDGDPGVYPIAVTVNGKATARMNITVTAGPGCTGDPTPKPIISGPGQVNCGDSIFYPIVNNGGGSITSAEWSSSSINITGQSTSGATLTFNQAGNNNISLRVNGSVTTNRNITVGACS